MLALLREAELPERGVAASFGNFLVIRSAGRVVAAAGLEVCGEHGLLRSVVVDPGFRGRGLAGRLVRALVARASRRRLRALYLLTTTARGFFLRQGFSDCARTAAPKDVEESWEFRSGCPASSSFMRRTLGRVRRP